MYTSLLKTQCKNVLRRSVEERLVGAARNTLARSFSQSDSTKLQKHQVKDRYDAAAEQSSSHVSSIGYRENFATRHIGVNQAAEAEMLKSLGIKSMDELVSKIVPKSIVLNRDLNLSEPMSKLDY